MQWIFLLIGLLIGLSVGGSLFHDDGTLICGLLGALIGLWIGQAIALQILQNQSAVFRQKLEALEARLRGETPSPAPTAPVPDILPQPTEQPRTQAAPIAQKETRSPEPWRARPPEEPLIVPPQPEPARVDLSSVGVTAAEIPTTPPDAASPDNAPPFEPRPAPPGAIPQPSGPSLLSRLLGGNLVLRIGVLLLFLGLAFLLRYASERVVVPVELRYAGVALAAIALLGLGWWLRRRNPGYGLMLQGTGIAVLYLTVFAAMRLHPLLSPQAALVLLVAVTCCSAMLAVLQDALGLAAVAALGGFAAPILVSTGGGSHVALFSSFALLNTGIFAIAWFKAWRLLNLIGFFGTFGIGLAWGLRSYTPDLFATTEPFLILFFLMYVAIGLLFARRRLHEAEGLAEVTSRGEQLKWSLHESSPFDGTVLFGAPLVGFGLQVAVIQHLEFGAAFSALALGLFYMVLARLLAGRGSERTLLLVEICLALGVIFGTMAIPLGLDARWTSAAWAVEGAGVYWIGLRQQRPLARLFALLVQAGAAVAFLGDLRFGDDTLLSGAPLGALMLGGALLASFWNLRRADPKSLAAWEPAGAPALSCTGLGFLSLTAPLCFAVQATAMSWALFGLATLVVGLRLRSRSFLFCAFAVQLLGGVLFLLTLETVDDGSGMLGSGWQGLFSAALIGLAFIAGVLIAARDSLVRDNKILLRGLALVMLLGLAFINFSVLFVLPWRSASAVWGGSSLLIIWFSLHVQQRIGLAFGLVLQTIGGAAFLLAGPTLFLDLSSEGLTPFAHSGFWTPVVLALAAMIGAWRLNRAGAAEQALGLGSRLGLEQMSRLLLVWGAGWWGLAVLSEIDRFVPEAMREHTAVLIAAFSVALWMLIALRGAWRAMAALCLALTPVAVGALARAWRPDYHPLAQLGWLAWPAVFAVHLLSLRRLEGLLASRWVRAAHVLGCWLVLGVLALESRYLFYALAEHYNAWRWLGWALIPSAFLILIGDRRAAFWPVSAYPREYRAVAALPVAALLLAWFWLVNVISDGAADPLPYLPLINPLELGMLIVLMALLRWTRSGLPQLGLPLPFDPPTLSIQAVLGASLFALLTMAACRTVHHWAGVPFDLWALQRSMLVQASLSIVWTSIALALMILGHLRTRRVLWMAGATLIGVVVIKLFFIELGGSGSLERIISFIGVGVLLLIVGYFAPLPPRRLNVNVEQEQPSS